MLHNSTKNKFIQLPQSRHIISWEPDQFIYSMLNEHCSLQNKNCHLNFSLFSSWSIYSEIPLQKAFIGILYTKKNKLNRIIDNEYMFNNWLLTFLHNNVSLSLRKAPSFFPALHLVSILRIVVRSHTVIHSCNWSCDFHLSCSPHE